MQLMAGSRGLLAEHTFSFDILALPPTLCYTLSFPHALSLKPPEKKAPLAYPAQQQLVSLIVNNIPGSGKLHLEIPL